MTTVTDFAEAMAHRTRPENAAPWDPVGLQLGDPEARVRSVAVCHEVTETVVSRLEDSPTDLLVTYHPLLFAPVNRLLAGRSPSARAFRLLRAGVALFVTHTDFDASPGGTGDALAGELDLQDVTPFGGNVDDGTVPIGRHGVGPATLGDLAQLVSERLGGIGLRVSGDPASPIDRVAVVPGSGSEYIDAAAGVARVLVTGDVSHHRAVRSLDLGLAVVDPGHIATERPGMRSLVALVEEVSEAQVIDLTHPSPETWR